MCRFMNYIWFGFLNVEQLICAVNFPISFKPTKSVRISRFLYIYLDKEKILINFGDQLKFIINTKYGSYCTYLR